MKKAFKKVYCGVYYTMGYIRGYVKAKKDLGYKLENMNDVKNAYVKYVNNLNLFLESI